MSHFISMNRSCHPNPLSPLTVADFGYLAGFHQLLSVNLKNAHGFEGILRGLPNCAVARGCKDSAECYFG